MVPATPVIDGAPVEPLIDDSPTERRSPREIRQMARVERRDNRTAMRDAIRGERVINDENQSPQALRQSFRESRHTNRENMRSDIRVERALLREDRRTAGVLKKGGIFYM